MAPKVFSWFEKLINDRKKASSMTEFSVHVGQNFSFQHDNNSSFALVEKV